MLNRSFYLAICPLAIAVFAASPGMAQKIGRKGKVKCPSVIIEKNSSQIRRRSEYLCFKNLRSAKKQGFSIDSVPLTPINGLWSVAASKVRSNCPVEPASIIGDTLPLREDGSTVLLSAIPELPAPFSGMRSTKGLFLSRPSVAECSIELQADSDNGLDILGSYFGNGTPATSFNQTSVQGSRVETMSFSTIDETSSTFEYQLKLNCPDFTCSVVYSGNARFLTPFPQPE